MGKRLWALLLALVMTFSLTACSRGKGGESDADLRIDIDPETLSQEACAFLCWFGWYNGAKYDAANITAATNVLACDFPHAVPFNNYPGPAAQEFQPSDPRGRYSSCSIYDGEKTDWILTNIFHYTGSDIDELRRAANQEALPYYYAEGKYYIEVGGVGGGYDVQPRTVQTDGEKYYITYDAWFGDGEMRYIGVQYAVMGAELIDGAYYWTLYEWRPEAQGDASSADPTPAPAETAPAAPDSPAQDANGAATSPWLGKWVASDGDYITVTEVQETCVFLTHSSLDEAGVTMHHTDYMLNFTDATKTAVAEDESLIASRGYRLVFTLHDGVITLSSRYPDQDFYKQ